MTQPKKVATSATGLLALLWEAEFFKTWRSIADVDSHVAKDGYNFSGPELGMAIMRARYLTRRGKPGSYQYIQKFPFVPEFARPTRRSKQKGAKK